MNCWTKDNVYVSYDSLYAKHTEQCVNERTHPVRIVAPSVDVIVEKVLVAESLAGATVVALKETGAVVGVGVSVGGVVAHLEIVYVYFSFLCIYSQLITHHKV